jgi:hypothetical protein
MLRKIIQKLELQKPFNWDQTAVLLLMGGLVILGFLGSFVVNYVYELTEQTTSHQSSLP